LKRLMEALDGASSIFHLSCGTPTDSDSTLLELALGQVEKLRKELGLSYTPKFPPLLAHVLRQDK
jgi:hypothetical protein